MKNADRVVGKVKNALRFDRSFRFVWQASRNWAIVSVILIFITGILPLATLFLMKLIVDAVTQSLTAPDKIQAFRHVLTLIALAGGVALVQVFLQLLDNLVREAQSLAVSDHMYGVIHAKSIATDLEYYENPKYFDTLHRAQQEGPYRPLQIVNGLMRLGQNSISTIAVVGLLISFHWLMAIILFFAALPGILVKIRFSGRLFQWQQDRTQTERRAGYFNWMMVGYGHAKEIRLFRLGNLFIKRFNRLRSLLRREKIDMVKKRSLSDFFAQVCATSAVFASFGFIVYRTVHGVITLGDMVMYFQAFQRGLGFFKNMLGGLADLYENNLFLTNLFEFLDLKSKVKEPARPLSLPHQLEHGVVFQHVDFNYPSGRKKVLDDISFSIGSQEVIALVGDNGSGKTTLIKLLCRLYDPTNGSIRIDGIDIRHLALDALRREISVIFQDYVHYHLTARENIWFGNIEMPPGHPHINEAARVSGAETFINRLPKAYETILGKWFEDGEELSIGEWQKIALARAFMGNSQIIVLDEPTSNLDVKTEHAVFERFRNLLNGRSAILISHRFSTVRMADRIIVLESGRITESGSHEALLQQGGTYADMFEKQAGYYR